MKRILFLVTVLLAYTGVQAQIVSSRSVGIKSTKQSTETEHIWRFGLNMMNFAGDGGEDLEKKIGYNITYGVSKPVGSVGTYWGMDFGFGSRGFKVKENDFEENLIAHNVQVSPFTFGWKYGVIGDLKVDVHFGAYASFDYTGKCKIAYDGDEESINMGDWEDDLEIDWNRYDAGLNIGFGIWYSYFNLDFNFQRGFIETAKESEAYTNNFMIRLGFAF